jgi:hypothetical protein
MGTSLARIERFAPLFFFLSLLSGLEIIYGKYFPNSPGLLGHDFAIVHPILLDGAFWYWQNGLFAIPWFTPAFCGGQPFFADTISWYYSLIQWLTFFVPPTKASHITLLVSCSMGYWAFFYLSNKVFRLSIGAAIVAGALAMFNGFMPYRFLVGEPAFQAFLLSAFVSHALLSQDKWSPWLKWNAGNSFWAGLALAYMFQSGLSSLMIPIGLGVVGIACLAQIFRKGVPFKIFLERGMYAGVFAAALCSSRILAGMTFMSFFPRDKYLLPGFPNLTDAISFPLLSLIFDSQTVSNWANLKLANIQWAVKPHEWAYQFGLTYFVLILTGLVCICFSCFRKARLQQQVFGHNNLRAPYFAILIIILFIPSALLWLNPQWNTFLKTLPIINTTSFPFRWIIIWIPLACIVGAMAWQVVESIIKSPTLRFAALAVFCLVMITESGLTNRDYYIDPNMQGYDPKWVNQAWVNGKQGFIPPISKIVEVKQDKYGRWPLPQNRNDSMVFGESFVRCYNPAYGYHLETLPIGRLRAGHLALDEQDGFLNIKNPACLIWPKENGCAILGEEYKVQDKEQAQLFLKRKPIDFEVSAGQKIANITNMLALLIAAAGIIAYAMNKIRRLSGHFNQ